jgi:uncharacterized protein YecT (DUF1311 family)
MGYAPWDAKDFISTPRYYLTVPIDRVGKTMRVAVWMMLPFLGLMSSAGAATFDCNKASTFVEKAICSDSRLTSMDDQLGRLYKDALAASADSAALKAEQRAWLSSRDQCVDSDCVIKAYEDRVSALALSRLPPSREISPGRTRRQMGRCLCSRPRMAGSSSFP